MKRILLTLTILSLLSFNTFSQTNTWIGALNSNWSIATNWSLGYVPTSSNNVVIPSGSNVYVDINASMNSINLQSNSTLLISQIFSFASASTFQPNSTVNWSSGEFTGGGTLTNKGVINLITQTNKFIYGLTTINNEGLITLVDIGDLYISNGTVNNQTTGIINFLNDACDLYYQGSATHVLNNYGLIKKSFGTSITTIQVDLHNFSNATIEVQTGMIDVNSASTTLVDGTFNVFNNAILRFQNAANCSGTFSGVLNGSLSLRADFVINPLNTLNLNFTGNSKIDWESGNMTGGGIINNNFKIDLPTTNPKFINGGSTFNNYNTMNITDFGDLFISNGILNNQTSGVIDFQINGGDITYNSTGLHILNNYGIIKKTQVVGISTIEAELRNFNSGIIQVENGQIDLANPLIILNGGTYNVFSSAFLQFGSPVTCSGNLNGVVNGAINWTSNIRVAPATTANLNFTGNSYINWISGDINGGGTLNNNFRIDLNFSGARYMNEGVTFNNFSSINLFDNGDLFISDATLNNQTTGIIDFKDNTCDITYGGSGLHNLNNSGIIQKSVGTGLNKIWTLTNNSGTIISSTGTLEFAGTLGLTNTTTGIIKGIATIDLPPAANFTNNGTFSPGASPGTLTVIGDFKSTSTSVLDVELNGSTQITQYDLLAIQGNAIFNGTVNVTLGFAPLINDTFIIVTTTGTITQCNLAPITTAEFGGFLYTFSVECLNDNQVVLRVTQKTLGIASNEFNEKSIVTFPNPTSDLISITNKSKQNLTSAKILDLNSRVLKSIDLKGIQNPIISFENFANGNYLLKIDGENNDSVIKRIVKN